MVRTVALQNAFRVVGIRIEYQARAALLDNWGASRCWTIEVLRTAGDALGHELRRATGNGVDALWSWGGLWDSASCWVSFERLSVVEPWCYGGGEIYKQESSSQQL